MVDDFFKWLSKYSDDKFVKCNAIYNSKSKDDPFHDTCIIKENGTTGTLVDEGLKNVLINDIILSGHFVETGTNLGYLIKELSRYSKLTQSCEISYWNHCMALYNLKDTLNVELYHLDSSEFLKEIKITDESVLFLDAHGGSYDDWKNNPLTKELNVIKEKGIKPIIYIHDFAVPADEGDVDIFTDDSFDIDYKYPFDYNPENGWKLDWDFIKEQVKEIYNDEYSLSFPQDYPSRWKEAGWIRIEKK